MSNPNEDAKAAAAVSLLHGNKLSSISHQGLFTVDQEALGKALSQLDITSHAAQINPADVTFLIDNLDLSKLMATNLLKAYDGDLAGALRAFMNPTFCPK